MFVGIAKITLHFPNSSSLKDKRQKLRSIIEKTKNRYNISIAEVADQDLWQVASIGVAFVSSDKRHANEVLSKVVDFISESRFEIEVLDYQIEIIPVSGD